MIPQPPGAARLRALLDSHAVRPSKALGQNFVIDPNTIRRMVEIARVQPTDRVLEIGPGAGSLTIELARAARQVVAVEADRALLPVLDDSLRGIPNVEVIHGDALRVELSAFGADSLVANLPYNIAASLVVKALETARGIGHLTVMTQREVGERLAAGPGSRAYGRVSVMCAFHARTRIAMRVSRRAFYPVPNVDSVVVDMERRAQSPDVDRAALSAVVRAAFSQRRKSLRNSLAPLVGSPNAAERAVRDAGIDPGRRPESLSLADFVALALSLDTSGAGAGSPPAGAVPDDRCDSAAPENEEAVDRNA